MKTLHPFDVQIALAGVPCKTRAGDTARVFYLQEDRSCGLLGIIEDNIDDPDADETELWTAAGEFFNDGKDYPEDLIGFEDTLHYRLEYALQKQAAVYYDTSNPELFESCKVIAKNPEMYLLENTQDRTQFWVHPSNNNDNWLLSPPQNDVELKLPRPGKPPLGQKYFYITYNFVDGSLQVAEHQNDADIISKNGNYFYTAKDAQAWVDALRGAQR